MALVRHNAPLPTEELVLPRTQRGGSRGAVPSGRRVMRIGEALTFGGEHSSIAILIAS
jgi:hypothetical protein